MNLTFDAADLFHPQILEVPCVVSLRVPEGITPRSLAASPIGRELILQDNTFDHYEWANKSIPGGVYYLRLPIPGSNNKTFDEQKALLLEGEDVASLVLLELALLCLKKAGFSDPLKGYFIRSPETAGKCRVTLCWEQWRLRVCGHSDWDHRPSECVWLAAARHS